MKNGITLTKIILKLKLVKDLTLRCIMSSLTFDIFLVLFDCFLLYEGNVFVLLFVFQTNKGQGNSSRKHLPL